jgi:hypothetical protein
MNTECVKQIQRLKALAGKLQNAGYSDGDKVPCVLAWDDFYNFIDIFGNRCDIGAYGLCILYDGSTICLHENTYGSIIDIEFDGSGDYQALAMIREGREFQDCKPITVENVTELKRLIEDLYENPDYV